jgi:hypothetical protein
MKTIVAAAAKGALITWAIIAAVPAEAQSFRNCDAVRAAGRAPILRGEPGFGAHLDRDDDGIGCEQTSGSSGAAAEAEAQAQYRQCDADHLCLEPSKAEIIRTTRRARVVVVGNPEVANAFAASDEAIVVTARTLGSTNLIALDEDGEEIVRTDIQVAFPPPAPRKQVRVRSLGGSDRRGSGELVRNYVCPPGQLCVLTGARGETPPVAAVQLSGPGGSSIPNIPGSTPANGQGGDRGGGGSGGAGTGAGGSGGAGTGTGGAGSSAPSR